MIAAKISCGVKDVLRLNGHSFEVYGSTCRRSWSIAWENAVRSRRPASELLPVYTQQ